MTFLKGFCRRSSTQRFLRYYKRTPFNCSRSFSIHDQSHVTTPHLLTPSKNPRWQITTLDDLNLVHVPEEWNDQLDIFQEKIGIRFQNRLHLQSALIHHGAITQTHENLAHGTRLSNRSFEFLGDSILGMCVSSYLYQAKPHYQEGELTRLKADLVNNETLSSIAELVLKIDSLILVASEFQLDKCPTNSTDLARYNKGRKTIQAGAVEALIAAIYVDQGLEKAIDFVNEIVLPGAMKHCVQSASKHPVAELQKLLQAQGLGIPIYRNVPAGSSDVFQVEIYVQGKHVLTSEGSSYKVAREVGAALGLTIYQID